MDEFPSNSRRAPIAVDKDEPKKLERVARGQVVRRKKPFSKRITENLIGGEPRSVWEAVFGEILIPAARDMIADATIGGVERMVFGDSVTGRGRRSSIRGGGFGNGHVSYDRYSKGGGRTREEPRREISRRGRANHSFDEIILETRVEAEEVLDRLDEHCAKYDGVSVADLYNLVGISSTYVDDKWGWTDVRHASVSRVPRGGYLLNLTKPEPLD